MMFIYTIGDIIGVIFWIAFLGAIGLMWLGYLWDRHKWSKKEQREKEHGQQ
jgi:hypothetical protein